MLIKTNFTITENQLQAAVASLPDIDSRLALNQQTGSFFNDPWEIKPEFKNTVWEEILDALDAPKGEARLIKLEPGTSYRSHADIDDRWHLSLVGDHAYLIDLENDCMYATVQDCVWYDMDAGLRHTAANFGSKPRIQLVVRKLLPKPAITDPVNISIKLKEIIQDRRFVFDDIVSPWLNRAYKQGIVDNFIGVDLEATMTIEASHLPALQELISSHFTVTIK